MSVLSPEQVRIHPGGATRDEALQEATDILVAAEAVTPAYVDAMRQREETVSTFMGNGLAIPHGTNDAKDTILASALSVVRYDGGVDWAGDPATFVIGIAEWATNTWRSSPGSRSCSPRRTTWPGCPQRRPRRSSTPSSRR